MIQRVQSIFLLLAVIVTGVMFITPFAGVFSGDGKMLDFFPYGLIHSTSQECQIVLTTIPLAVLTGIIALITFFAIFLFQNRNLQARLCVISMLLLVGLCGIIYFYINYAKNQIGGEVHYYYPLVFPLVCLVLVFLARKKIVADEELVRSADRIR